LVSVDFFEEWLALTQMDDLVTDAPSKLAKEYGELVFHAHVTSIFSLLVKKHGFKRFPEPTDRADEVKLSWTNLGVPQEAFTSDFDEKIERPYPRILTAYWGNPFAYWLRTEIFNPKAKSFPFEKMRRNFEQWGLKIPDFRYESVIFDRFVPDFLKQVRNDERTFSEYLDMFSQLKEQGIEISCPLFNESIFENFIRKFIDQTARGEITIPEYLKRRSALKKQGFKISAVREIGCFVKYLVTNKPFDAEPEERGQTASVSTRHVMPRTSKKSACYRHPKLLEKPIVIYGASRGGMTAQEDLLKLGVTASNFCDSAESRHGQSINGVEVISPAAMIEKYGTDGANILIGSESYYYEIHNKLLSMGIPEDNILPNKIDIYLNSGCAAKPIEISAEQLSALKRTLVELMIIMHDICEKHGLSYYLFGGTLLGAVRHKGFIPWDDDVDIVMPRNDYERFFKLCRTELPDGYYVSSPYDAADCFHLYFHLHQLRKKDTVWRHFRNEDYLPGNNAEVYIDIFPEDNVIVPNGKMHKFQDIANIVLLDAMRMKYGIETNPQNEYRRFSGYFSFLPKKFLCRLRDMIISLYRNKKTDYMCWFIPLTSTAGQIFRTSIFKEKVLMEFEGHGFWVPAGYEVILQRFYGDYMRLPPESERCSRHPISELVV
jgi:lipopolysaccharide cholinephosphotransferase